MKSIGIVRKIDPLGRITLPKEVRKQFNINDGDPLEMFVDEEGVYVRKYVSDVTKKQALQALKEISATIDEHNKESLDKAIKELESIL